jgi:O-antigen/teichoic acid export membrane protein
LSVWAAFTIINYLFSIILIGNGQSKKAFLLTLPQLFMIVVSTSLLVPRYEGFGAAVALIATAFLGNIFGTRMVAGDDKSACHVLTMVFLRAAVPLLLLLIAAPLAKDSFLLLVGFACIAIALLIAVKAITLNDIKALHAALTGMVKRIPAPPTIV